MKKLFPFIIGLMMLISLVEAAPPLPAPVKITLSVNGQKVDYLDTKVTNLRTGEILTKDEVGSLAITNGIGLFDLSEFEQGYVAASPVYNGDEIKIVACNVHPDCTQTFRIVDTDPRTIAFSITTGNIYVCWDNSMVTDPNDCPEQPEPEPEPEPEPLDKISSNEDETIAFIEAYYGQEFDICIGNNKLAMLLDDVIEFDNEDYDVREEVCLNGAIKTSLDDKDFELTPYLIVSNIEYKYIFDDEIDLTEIDEDEELEIDFLGKPIRIIEASANEFTLRTGDYEFLAEGESIIVDDKTVEIKTIGENSILIDVSGTEEIIAEGNSREINDVHIIVEEILYKLEGASYVELLVGTNADTVVRDGDDFELFIEDDEEYKWVINLPEYIGVINQEEYLGIDEDDDYHAIKLGEVLVLPNDYLRFGISKITESDVVEMNIRVKDSYLYVRGNLEDSFIFGSDEYDRLYIDSTGIYDDDEEFITDDKVRIGDSDTYLELGSIKIGKLEIKLDMSDILYDGVSFALEDADFLDYFGIIFKDPENAVEDKEGFFISVPEERPEITISIGSDFEVVIPIPEPEPTTTTIPPKPEPPTEPEPKPIPTTVPIPTIPVVTTTIPPTIEPEPTKWDEIKDWLIGLIAGIIGVFAWGKGFAGLIKYYLKKAKEADKIGDKELAGKYRERAEKMAKTTITNFLAGKYKK
jgi:hypothetical protein